MKSDEWNEGVFAYGLAILHFYLWCGAKSVNLSCLSSFPSFSCQHCQFVKSQK